MKSTTRTAITLSETLIATVVIGLLLLVTAMGIDSVRTELRRQQVWSLLALLDQSLDAYHDATGRWPATQQPPTPSTTQQVEPSPDHYTTTCRQIITALSAMEQSRRLLQDIPAILREQSPGDDQAPPFIRDAWGTRLRCLAIDAPSRTDRQAVAARGNKPIFVSAGTDRQFGLADGVGEADNLRSDELPR